MSTTVLSKDRSRTEPFTPKGDVYICVKGEGKLRFLRDMGNSYEPVTDQDGEELIYLGDKEGGIIFNSHITCNGRIKHVVEVITTTSAIVTVKGV